MRYTYLKVNELEGTEKVGTKQCVELIKHYAKAPSTGLWREGGAVISDRSIVPGTAIATFVNRRYPNHGSGNHAAFYVSQDSGGMWIMDQWSSDERKPKVSKRYIRRQGK